MMPPVLDIEQHMRDRSPSVVDGWYQAVRGAALARRSRSEVRSELAGMWERVVAFLASEDDGIGDAESIGTAFGDLGVRAEAVGHVVETLLTTLLQRLPDDVQASVEARVPVLVGGMMIGLFRVSTENLLEQQEEIRASYGEALLRIEDQLRIRNAGIESSINAIAMIDLEARVTYVNPAFLELWGYGSDREVLGRPVSDFGEWRGDTARALEYVSEQGGWMGELVAVREDGSRFDVQASVSPVYDGAGSPQQLMVFFVDISERVRTEEALARRALQAAFLNEIGEQIASERTADAVLDKAVQLAHQTFDFDQVSVLLFEREGQVLEVAALAGGSEDLEPGMFGVRLGEGITGWVARENRTVMSHDVSADPRYVQLAPDLLSTRSELAVPICIGGSVIGVVDVQSPVEGAFGTSDRVVLETLADQIAVALENARLYQAFQNELGHRRTVERALRRTVRRLETVHEIDQAILAARSRQDVGEAVLVNVKGLVPCQRGSINLFDWERGEVTVLAAFGGGDGGRMAPGTRFPITQGKWLLEHWRAGGLVGVRQVEELPQSSPWARALIEEGIKSVLSAPISYGDQLMGLLTLESEHGDAFEPEHASIARELADTLAIAIRQTRLIDSVTRHRERLRRTMGRLAEAEETERRRVVRELHDRVGQNMTALDLNLSMVRSQLEKGGLEDLGSRLEDSLSIVAETTATIRQLMIDLRPPVLDDYGLLPTLHWYGDRFAARTGIGVTVRGREEDAAGLSPHVENALFRICQEALTNVAKHARATHIDIALTLEGGKVRVTIADNGVGFRPEDTENDRESWGLLTMRERAQSVGARCIFDSVPGEGTRVLLEVPA